MYSNKNNKETKLDKYTMQFEMNTFVAKNLNWYVLNNEHNMLMDDI